MLPVTLATAKGMNTSPAPVFARLDGACVAAPLLAREGVELGLLGFVLGVCVLVPALDDCDCRGGCVILPELLGLL